MTEPKFSALILIADGTEEMEFTITYDTFVRAGIACTSAYVVADGSQNTTPIVATGSRGIKFLPDVLFSKINEIHGATKFDILIIPGGAKGAATMSESPAVQSLVRDYIEQDKIVGMICAGSLAALTSKLPKQPLTSHPSVKEQLQSDFEYKEDSVVVSGKLVTSRGPGTTFPFALTIISILLGPEKRKDVSSPMVFPEGTPW